MEKLKQKEQFHLQYTSLQRSNICFVLLTYTISSLVFKKVPKDSVFTSHISTLTDRSIIVCNITCNKPVKPVKPVSMIINSSLATQHQYHVMSTDTASNSLTITCHIWSVLLIHYVGSIHKPKVSSS